jgi:hypothetical protein
MITPNPPSPEPPPDDANRPRSPPDTRISVTPPPPASPSEPFPVDERPFHRRRPDAGERARRVILIIWVLAVASCFGVPLLLWAVCSQM